MFPRIPVKRDLTDINLYIDIKFALLCAVTFVLEGAGGSCTHAPPAPSTTNGRLLVYQET